MADDIYIPTSQDAQDADQAYTAQSAPAPVYVPTAQDAQQADKDYYGESGFPSAGYSATAQSESPPPPTLAPQQQTWLQKIESAPRVLGQELKALPGAALKGAESAGGSLTRYIGQGWQSALDDPSIDAKLGTSGATPQFNKATDAIIPGAIKQAGNASPMLLHGYEAARQGSTALKSFIEGVPAGIANKTLQDPLGQIGNVLAIVSGGELAMGAGAKSLVGLADRYAASAAKMDAIGDSATAANYRGAAQKATSAAQGLNRAAFTVHRVATGGAVGDIVRDHVATVAEKVFPGSDMAAKLRARADLQLAAANNLRGLAAEKAAVKEAAANAAPFNEGGQDIREGAIPIQPALAPPPDDVLAPTPQAPEPESPTPPPEPVIEPPVAPPATAAEPPATPGTEPFQTDYQAKQAAATQKYTDVAEQSGHDIADPATQQAIQKAANTSLQGEFDAPTGLLNSKSLDATMGSAAKYVKETGTPATYVQVRPTTTLQPMQTRQLADFLQGELQKTAPSVSVHLTPSGDIGGVLVGADPEALGTALTSAQQQVSELAAQSGAAHPVTPAFTFGTAPITPTVKPADTQAMGAAMLGAPSGMMTAALMAAQAQENQNATGKLSGTAASGTSGTSGGSAASGNQAGSARGSRSLVTASGAPIHTEPVSGPGEGNSGGGVGSVSAGTAGPASTGQVEGTIPAAGRTGEGHQPEGIVGGGFGGRSAGEPGGANSASAEANAAGAANRTSEAALIVRSGPYDYPSHNGFSKAKNAEAVSIPGLPHVETFLHKTARAYEVSDARSGHAISSGLTKEQAINRASRAVKDGVHFIDRRIAAEIKNSKDEKLSATGETPYYTNRNKVESLTPEEVASVKADLEKIKGDPLVGAISQDIAAQIEERKASEEKGKTDEATTNDAVRIYGNGSVEGGQAQDVQGAESKRQATASGLPSAGNGEDSGMEPDAGRLPTKRGTGDSDTSVPGTSKREGNAGAGSRPSSTEQPTESIQPATGREPTPGRVLTSEAIADAEQAHSVGQPLSDYRVTPEDAIGSGGVATKERDALAAINTLQKVEAADRLATPDEQKILARFPGWGWTGNSLNRNKEGSNGFLDSLLDVLSPQEVLAAKRATLNSHYTTPFVIEAMWEWIAASGFTGGNFLEPSAGIGLFLALAPPDIRRKLHARAVELDNLTGRILKQLQQTADVNMGGYEAQKLPTNYYDVIASNVPFGRNGVTDKEFNRLGFPSTLSAPIHNYFFVKSIRVARPGGLIAFITSHGTLDSGGNAVTARKFMQDEANLIGAIRLPNTAFKGNAGTEVTTDIIFLQKKGNDSPDAGEAFGKIVNVGTPSEPINVNEYFARHPEFVLGTHSMAGKMNNHAGAEYTLMPHDGDLQTQLLDAIHNLPTANLKPYTHVSTSRIAATQMEGLQRDERRGKFLAGAVARAPGGGIAVIQPDGSSELVRDLRVKAQIERYLDLRESLLKVLSDQRAGVDDAALKKSQSVLAKSYDAYTNRHGYLHAANNKVWQDDPDAQNVLALENWKAVRAPSVGGKPSKRVQVFDGLSDQFTKRTQVPNLRPSKADGAREALLIAMRETGNIDLPRMAELAGEAQSALLDDLKGIVFRDPAGGYMLAGAYGSGNVKAKLEEAKKIAKDDPSFKDNIAFLETVQPQPLSASQISAKLGAPWIPTTIYEDFADYISGGLYTGGFKVAGVNTGARFSWSITGPRRDSTAAHSTYGTKEVNAVDLMQFAMNGKTPRVYDGRGQDRVFLPDETKVATVKQGKLRDVFSKWIVKDAGRADRIAKIYNDTVNVNTREAFDGVSVYAKRDAARNIIYRGGDKNKPEFQFEGMNPLVALRIHQVNAVWRIMQQVNTLLAHEVGTGKTFTMVTACMELRRLGIRNKPCIVVKPRTLPQIAADFIKLYPGAKVLVGSQDAVKTPALRQRFMARAATGDWDAVIVSHNCLELLPISGAEVESFYKRIIDEQRTELDTARKGNDTPKFTVKQIENSITALENNFATQMAKLDRAKDQGLTFEEMGIDHFFVDESHKYKNQTVTSTTEGMAKVGGPVATDFFIKMRYLQNAGGGVTFATGTPLTNSISEIHTLMKMLAPQKLSDSGLSHFDAFARQYADITTKLERTTDLSYRERSQLSEFSNIPELMTLYLSFADPVLAEDVPELVRPKLVDEDGNVTDEPIVVVSHPNPHQRAYYRNAKIRTSHIPPGPPEPGQDTVIKIGTDVRMASLDIRLRWKNAPDYPDSKINQTVEKVYREYSDPQNMKDLRTQLVFLDLGIDFLYADIKKKLVAKGITAAEIQFIGDADTDEKLEDLFDDVNDGVVRVVIGSREKMGVGVNVQSRLIAIHQVDPTYRPDQMEQADGRILRHGNLFHEQGVRIYKYVNEGSGDAFMWNKVARKARFISQVTNGAADMRTATDIGAEDSLSEDDIAAIADGNPFVIEWKQAKDDLESLQLMSEADAESKRTLQSEAKYLAEKKIPDVKQAIANLETSQAYILANTPEAFTMKVGAQSFDDRKEAATKLWEDALALKTWGSAKLLGEYKGYRIFAETDNSISDPRIKFTLTPGQHSNRAVFVTRPRTQYDGGRHSMLIAAFDKELDVYPDRIVAEKSYLNELESELPKMEDEARKPFDDEAKVHELIASVDRLHIKMGEAELQQKPDEAQLEFDPGTDYVLTKGEQAAVRENEALRTKALDPANSYFIKSSSTQGYNPVKGTPIKLPEGFEGVELFVHPGPGKKEWTVSEASTGLRMAVGTTKDGAIEQVIAKIEDVGPEKLRESVKKSVDKEGLSPRGEARQKAAEEFLASNFTAMAGHPPRPTATIVREFTRKAASQLRMMPMKVAKGAGHALEDLVLDNANTTLSDGQYLKKYASADTFAKFLEAASADPKAGVQLFAVANKMIKILGTGARWQEFITMLVESRLRGIRDRWNALSAQAKTAQPDDLIDSTTTSGVTTAKLGDAFGYPLAMLDGTQDAYDGIFDNAGELLRQFEQDGDPELIRAHLSAQFKAAAKSTHSILPKMSDVRFMETMAAPSMQEALKLYKATIEAEMAKSHASNEGMFSDALGPLDTYYPLMPLDDDGNPMHRPAGKGAEFSSPANQQNKYATGQSGLYDVTPKGLRTNILGAFRRNSQAQFMQGLISDGLLLPLEVAGEKASDSMIDNTKVVTEAVKKNGNTVEEMRVKIGGREFPAREVPVSTDKLIINKGKVTFVPGTTMVAPKWLVEEVGPLVHHTLPEWGGGAVQLPGIAAKILKVVNFIGMTGPLDAVLHTNNLIGTLVSETPFVPGGLLANTPLTKNLGAMVAISRTDPSSDVSLMNMAEMARVGNVPSRYGRETYSAAQAKATGAELNRLSFGPVLFGASGIDIRSRIIMWRVAKVMAGLDPNKPIPTNPDGTFTDAQTIKDMAAYCSRLGQYNRALMGRMERMGKDTQIAPWATAGNTMYRNGVRAWLGGALGNSLPTRRYGGGGSGGGNGGGGGGFGGLGSDDFKHGAKFHIAKLLTGGAFVFIGVWVLLHHAFTGKWPWQDNKSRLLMLPIPASERHSKIVEMLYGKGDNTVYVGMGYFNPIAFRGAGAIGLKGSYNTKMMGGNSGDEFDTSAKDAWNAAAGPYLSGPGFRSVFSGISLDEPYVTGWRDAITGSPGIELEHMTGRVKQGALPFIAAHANAAASGVNATAASVEGVFGYGNKARQMQRLPSSGRVLKIITDLAFPRLLGSGPDPAFIFNQMQRADRAANAEDLKVTDDVDSGLRSSGIYIGALQPGTGESHADFEARKSKVEAALNRILPNAIARSQSRDPSLRQRLLKNDVTRIKAHFAYRPAPGARKALAAFRDQLMTP